MPDTIERLQARLESWIRARAAELAQEVRNYPSPIARCDDQLPRLLEQQRHAYDALDRVQAAGQLIGHASPAALREALLACLDAPLFAEPQAAAIGAEFRAALPDPSGPSTDRRNRCAPDTVWTDDGGRSAA